MDVLFKNQLTSKSDSDWWCDELLTGLVETPLNVASTSVVSSVFVVEIPFRWLISLAVDAVVVRKRLTTGTP